MVSFFRCSLGSWHSSVVKGLEVAQGVTRESLPGRASANPPQGPLYCSASAKPARPDCWDLGFGYRSHRFTTTPQKPDAGHQSPCQPLYLLQSSAATARQLLRSKMVIFGNKLLKTMFTILLLTLRSSWNTSVPFCPPTTKWPKCP